MNQFKAQPETPGLPSLTIGPVRAELPIIQGGMGVGVSLSGLASAVSDAGGIGVISAALIGMLEPDYERNVREANRRALIKEIRIARQKTSGVIGCNLMVALSDYDDLVETVFDEGVDLLFIGAGLPLKFSENVPPERLKNSHTRIVPIVSSARAFKLIFQTWDRKFATIPDAVVVEGPLAGGHLGFKKEQLFCPAYSLDFLIEEVVSAAKPFEQQYGKPIPVIAAGGIYTGKDIKKFLNLGASGVQMGTRFVATHECDADIRFKEMYLNARKEDMAIISSPVGLPGRAIRNRFLDDVRAGQKKPFKCPSKCLKTCNFKEAPYCIARALTNAKRGNTEDGFVFAGSNAWRVNEIVSVQDLFDELQSEFVVPARIHAMFG